MLSIASSIYLLKCLVSIVEYTQFVAECLFVKRLLHKTDVALIVFHKPDLNR